MEKKNTLSGCEYDRTIDFLQVRDRIKPGCTVLEVGVGLGYVTRGFFENGAKVSAVDISELGLERVLGYCEGVYSINELEKLPSDYFDVIICHNVVQHVPTGLLVSELMEFVRSLKGVFAVEFVSSDQFADNGEDAKLSDVYAGRLCRTPEFMEGLFNNLGANCKLVHNVDYSELGISFLTGAHILHVTK